MTPLYNGLPKILHQIWLGSAVPARWDGYRQSWRDTHPGWEFKLWTEENIGPVIEQSLCPDLIKVSAGLVQARANLLRLEVLRQHGGVYADLDILCFRPLEHLLPAGALVYSDASDHWPNNCYLAAPPGHPFLPWCLQLMQGWSAAWTRPLTGAVQCDIMGMKGFAHAIRAWAGLHWANAGPVLDDAGVPMGTLWEQGFAHLNHKVFQAAHPFGRPRNENTFSQLIAEAQRERQAYGIHVGAKEWS